MAWRLLRLTVGVLAAIAVVAMLVLFKQMCDE